MRLRALTAATVAAALSSAGCGALDDLTASPANGARQQATIERAVDGDTLLVRTADGQRQRVRLLAIDTPESVRPGIAPECLAKKASANLARLAPSGARVTLRRDPTQDAEDRYGRWLRYAAVDGRDLGLQQVRAGLADVYVFDGNPAKRVARYQAAARKARSRGAGVWGACGGDFHRGP